MAVLFSPIYPFGQLDVYQIASAPFTSVGNARWGPGAIPDDEPFASLMGVSLPGDATATFPGSASISGMAGEGDAVSVTVEASGNALAAVLLEVPLVLAPIVSQAPRTVPVEIGLVVSGATEGPQPTSSAAFRVSSPAGTFGVGGDFRNGDIAANGSIRAGDIFLGRIDLSAVGGVALPTTTVGVTAANPRIEGRGTVTVDGASVAPSGIYVLVNAADLATPLPADEYPSAAGLVDGFDFDPTALLSVRGGTVTARGVDEDGFGGNALNIVEDLLVRVEENASVLTIEDRDYAVPPIILDPATPTETRNPAIDLRGDRNVVENDGLIRTERTDNYAVLLAGLEVGLFNRGAIESAADRSGAVLLGGPSAYLENEGQISSAGEEVITIEMLDRGANLVNRGDVLADGDRSIGIYVDNTLPSGYDIPDGETPAILPGSALVNNGNVIAEGASTLAVVAILDEGTIDNLGRIERSLGGAQEDQSEIGAGLLLLGRDVAVENVDGARIAADGDLAPALAAFGSGIDVDNAGEILSAGDRAEPVLVVGEDVSFENGPTGRVATSGNEAPAVRIGPVRGLENVVATDIGGFETALLALLESDGDSAEIAALLAALLEGDLTAARFENAGAIESDGIASPAVIVNASEGMIDNRATGEIRSARDFGLIVGGEANTITNAGEIATDAAEGSATIRAVWIEAGESTFENLRDGAVDGGIVAVLSEVDDAQERTFDLQNREGATVEGPEAIAVLEARRFDLLNEGTISADVNGLRVGTDEDSAEVTVRNEPTGVFRGTAEEAVGIRIRADGTNSAVTVANLGTIDGVLDGIVIAAGDGASTIVVTNGSDTEAGEIAASGFGIDLATAGTVTVTNGREGEIAAATGIFARDARLATLDNAGSIEATGTERQVARGIDVATERAGGRIEITQTGTVDVSPFAGRADDPRAAGITVGLDAPGTTATVTNRGTITMGPDGDRRGAGIEAEVQSQGTVRITNVEGATIAAQTGISVTGGSDVRVVNEGRIDIDASRDGVALKARDIGNEGTYVVQNSGRITADGEGVIGVSVIAGAASGPDERMSRLISLELDLDVPTEIEVTGDNAVGAELDVVAAFVENTGALSVTGDDTFGVKLRGADTLAVLSNELEVFGADAVGLEIEGQRNAAFNGQGSAALPDFARLLEDRGAEPVRFFSSQFDFTGTSNGADLQDFPTGTIAVSGENAIGVSLGGSGNTFVNVLGDSVVDVRPGDVIATGDGARALVFTEGGNYAYNAGRLATSETVAVSGSSGRDILVNDNQIFGEVRLAGGDDLLLVNPGAEFDRGADGGAGEDILLASSGFTGDPDDLVATTFDATDFTSFELFRQVGDRPFILAGTLGVPEAIVEGTMILAGATISGAVTVSDGAVLTGFGRVGNLGVSPTGLVLDPDGLIRIGTSPGVLTVEGDAVINGQLVLELGATPAESDRLEATGVIDLSGADLVIEVAAMPTGAVELFSASQIVGLGSADIEFLNVPSGMTASLSPDGTVDIGPAADTPPTVLPPGPEVPPAPRADTLVGTSLADTLGGGDGDDTILGRDGGDLLDGGPGDDSISGEAGDDTLRGGDGDDVLSLGEGDDTAGPGPGRDRIILGSGTDTVVGTPAEVDGDTVVGFGSDDDAILVEDSLFDRDDVTVAGSPVSLAIDTDGDGAPDSTIVLEGDFLGGDFMAAQTDTDTVITFEEFLPVLADRQAVDPDFVNGIVNELFLTSPGRFDYRVTLRDLGFAGYDNVVGAYEVAPEGDIVDVRILFENANADKAASVLVTGVEAGHRLAFFLLQDAADWFDTLADEASFGFVDANGAPANIADGADVRFAVDGAPTDRIVFHSVASSLNPDGLQHVLSGVDPGGQTITVGFEDLLGGGDRDYEDVVMRIAQVDPTETL